jgi:hypothetical protein
MLMSLKVGFSMLTGSSGLRMMNRLVALDLISRGAIGWCLWTWAGRIQSMIKPSLGEHIRGFP